MAPPQRLLRSEGVQDTRAMRLGVAAGPFRSLAVARRDGVQQGTVLVGEGWTVVQAVQHCEMVTQHDVLKVGNHR